MIPIWTVSVQFTVSTPRSHCVCAGKRAVAYWGLSIIYPQFWDSQLGSPRTVNTTVTPSTFLIRITSETLQHHQLWLIVYYNSIGHYLQQIKNNNNDHNAMRVKSEAIPSQWERLLLFVGIVSGKFDSVTRGF